MQISGHKTRAIFDRYNIVSERDLTDAAQKMERFQSARVESVSGTATDEVKATERGTRRSMGAPLRAGRLQFGRAIPR